MTSSPPPEVPPIRVLGLTVSLGGGGAEKHLVRVLNHLDRARFEIEVAVVRGGGDYEGELASDVPVHVLQKRQRGSSTGQILRSVRPLRALFEARRPDIVLAMMDVAGLLALRARGSGLRPAIVVGVQGPQREYAEAQSPVARAVPHLARRLYPSADGVIALSEGVRGELTEAVPAIADRTVVIPNAGLDAAVERLRHEPLPDGFLPPRPLAVACGRLTRQKGFPTLLRALQIVNATTPLSLWIVGDGPDRQALEDQALALGLSDRVRFAGFQPNPFAFMAAADVFVLSSLWEGFGNVVVEAMACETPVVSTDCRFGPAEILAGEAGLLVPVEDPKSMADAILRLLADPDLADRLARRGRARALEYAAPAVAAAYGEYLARVAAATPQLVASHP